GGRHPGAVSDFWSRACQERRRNGCETWMRTMNVSCLHGSGRACVALGLALDEGRVLPRNVSEAAKEFGRACDLKTPGACPSLLALVRKDGRDALREACDNGDGESCFILASLYYAGAGVPNDFAASVALFRRSCDAGWPRGCGGLGECYKAGHGTSADTAQAIHYFEKACGAGIAASCFSAATMYRALKDETLAGQRFRQACNASLGAATANAAFFRAGISPEPEAAPAFCTQLAQ